MAIVDHESKIKLNYSPDDVYLALKYCVKNLPAMKIDRINDTMKRIYMKAGVSLFSWGENITVSINSIFDGTSEVSILSTPKTGLMFGGAVDMGKNRKNINDIIAALSNELKQYIPVDVNAQNNTVPDATDQIKKLAELKEQGILTEDEFSEKKKQLLETIK